MEDEIGTAYNMQGIKRNSFKVLMSNAEGKLPTRRRMHVSENNIKRDPENINLTGARDIYLLYKIQVGSGTHPAFIQWL
jgi:hypothetical protein